MSHHLDTVDVRKAEVDDRDIRLVRAGIDRSAPARARFDDPIAFGAKRQAQETPDLRLVLNDEDGRA